MNLVSNRSIVYFSIFILLLILRVFKYGALDLDLLKLGVFSLVLFIPNLFNERSKLSERFFGSIVFLVLMLRFEANTLSYSHFLGCLFFLVSFQFRLLLWPLFFGAVWFDEHLIYLLPVMLMWRFGGIKIFKSQYFYFYYLLVGMTALILTRLDQYSFLDRFSLAFDHNFKSMQVGFFIGLIIISMEREFSMKAKLFVSMILLSSLFLNSQGNLAAVQVNLIFLYLVSSMSVYLLKSNDKHPTELVMIFLLWSLFGGIF